MGSSPSSFQFVRTRLGENLNRPEGPDAPFWLVFPHYDVKNRIKLEFPLKGNLTELIDEYLSKHRKVLLRGSTEDWLFPGESGSFKTQTMFSEQITEAVEKDEKLTETVRELEEQYDNDLISASAHE